jgi:hypothetical protein
VAYSNETTIAATDCAALGTATLVLASGLAPLAECILAAHQQVGLSGQNLLAHALTAGDALLAARAQVEYRGWLNFLRECGLSDDKAERYMYLARHRAELSDSARVRNLSLNAALRLIKRPPGDSKSPRNKKKASATPKLDPIAWGDTSLEEQRKFLDGVGLNAVLAAMPPAWREILRADDIGEHSAGERACLQAHVEELAAEVARLKRQNTSLQSEVACQRPAKATDDRIATLARKATALMSHPTQNVAEVYKALAQIRRLAEPEAGNGKPIAISPTNESLDTAAFRRAMALPASEAQR